MSQSNESCQIWTSHMSTCVDYEHMCWCTKTSHSLHKMPCMASAKENYRSLLQNSPIKETVFSAKAMCHDPHQHMCSWSTSTHVLCNVWGCRPTCITMYINTYARYINTYARWSTDNTNMCVRMYTNMCRPTCITSTSPHVLCDVWEVDHQI